MSLKASGSGRGRYVVALDFGTTYSGFAYRQKSDPLERVLKFYEWKNRGGRREYCKTITALYYESADSEGRNYQLKGWGWTALQNCTAALKSAFASGGTSSSSNYACVPELSRSGATCFNLHGNNSGSGLSACYVEQFKLDLLKDPSDRMRLPGDLNIERLIIDYLQCLGEQAMEELHGTFSNNLTKDAVEWCLTVPSIWTERAKQIMRNCAQKAGLVQACDEIDIILEPEGASMYCHEERKHELKLCKGDRLLVADIGGGTIDLVVHTKIDDDSTNVNAVEEVVPSYGKAGGGTFVDASFFEILAEKISCLNAHFRKDPSARLTIDKQWQVIKTTFQGEDTDDAMLSLPDSLKNAWRKHERGRRREGLLVNADDEDGNEDNFSDIMLEANDFRRIFDPEVEKVIGLIKKEVRGVKVLMLVGGFASCEYLKRKVRAEFEGVVEQIVVPLEPGSAICHGAVLLHLLPQSIAARKKGMTYGLHMGRTAKGDDPAEFVYEDDDGTKMCKNFFHVFVQRGERVPRNKSITKIYYPIEYGQKEMQLSLYSCPHVQPKFITDAGCMLEGSFSFNMEAGLMLEKARQVEVTMVFGASLITVSAAGKNFGDGSRVERKFDVTFTTSE